MVLNDMIMGATRPTNPDVSSELVSCSKGTQPKRGMNDRALQIGERHKRRKVGCGAPGRRLALRRVGSYALSVDARW